LVVVVDWACFQGLICGFAGSVASEEWEMMATGMYGWDGRGEAPA